jgi:uncharacterized Fe-S cluster-containing radical SAM superfamily protein
MRRLRAESVAGTDQRRQRYERHRRRFLALRTGSQSADDRSCPVDNAICVSPYSNRKSESQHREEWYSHPSQVIARTV